MKHSNNSRVKNVSGFRFLFGNLNLDKKMIQNTFDGMISTAHWCYQAQEHAFPN